VATKIKLMRLGKMRAPYYRIVVADSRTKRDGRSIETIGKYHPKEDPSFIEVDSDRAQYWLSVGAQPTEAVAAILRVTGDWQRFRGEPAPAPMKIRAPKPDKREVFNEVARNTADAAQGEATTPRRRGGRTEAQAVADTAADAPAGQSADQAAADAAAQGTTLGQARADGASGTGPADGASGTGPADGASGTGTGA